MNDIPRIIDLVSIELTGSEFRTEQETALRQKLKTESFAVMVRGQHSIGLPPLLLTHYLKRKSLVLAS